MQLKIIAISIGALSFGLLSACATTKQDLPAVVEEQVLAPGKVAIVEARYVPQASFNNYAQGRGAAAGERAGAYAGKGALTGAGFSLYAALHMPLLLPFLPVIVPFAAVTGAVVGGAAGAVSGAWSGMPSEHVAAIHKPIDRVLRDEPLHRALTQHVMALGADLPHYRFIEHADLGPTAPDQAPDYQELKAKGFDSVLELAVPSVGFSATAGEPPYVNFEMSLRARVVPFSAKGSWIREYTHRGSTRRASDWQADDGRLLNEELNEAYRALAKFLAESVFSPASAE